MRYPMDCSERKKGSKAKQILHYKLNADHWDFKFEAGGNDFGRDCIIELSEDGYWKNHKIEGQIKGVSKPSFISAGQFLSFPMEVKTINYALGTSNAFILFVVNLTTKKIYYQCIQQYMIDNPFQKAKLFTDQEHISIRIPISNVLTKDDSNLQKFALTTYQKE